MDIRLPHPANTGLCALFQSGLWTPASPHTTRTTTACTADTAFYVPFWIGRTIQLDRIAVEPTATSANSVTRLGVYSCLPGYQYPGALILDAGQQSTAAADTTLANALTINLTLTPGCYYASVVGQTATPTLRTSATLCDGVPTSAANVTGSIIRAVLTQASVTAGLPNPAVPDNINSTGPIVFFRAV